MMTMDPEDFISHLTPQLRARVTELQVWCCEEQQQQDKQAIAAQFSLCGYTAG